MAAADFPNSPTGNQKYRISATRTNLLTNPNFETNTTGWETTGVTVSITRIITNAYIGTGSVQVTLNDPTNGTGLANFPTAGNRIPVSANTNYTISAYVKQTSGTAIGVDLDTFYYNSGGTQISSSDGPNTTLTSSWQRISRTITTPALTTSMGFSIGVQQVYSGLSIFIVDAVLMEEGSELLPYFDGTFAKGEMYGQSWTGTANASTSTARYYLSPRFNYSSPTWSVVAGDAGGEPISTVNVLAKGNLISGSGSSAVTFRTVGTNGQLLTADSSTASGLNYTAAPASSATSLGAITNVTLTSVAENEGLTWNGTAWVNSSYPFFGAYVINRKSAAYTLQLTDKNKLLEVSSDVTVQVSVPTNALVAFPVGSQIHLIQLGTGQVTVGGVGITFGGRTKLRDQYSMGTLIKRATDTWVLVGDTAD